MKVKIVCCLVLLLISCSHQPPKSIHNACDLAKEKKRWYKAAKRTQKKWGVPVHVQWAIIHKESHFRAKAQAKTSSAYGFCQATKATWKHYQEETGRPFARRDNFSDCSDFIGWYGHRVKKKLGIKKHQAKNLYLVYHEGIAGFLKGKHKKSKALLRYANEVESIAKKYQKQLKQCKK